MLSKLAIPMIRHDFSSTPSLMLPAESARVRDASSNRQFRSQEEAGRQLPEKALFIRRQSAASASTNGITLAYKI